MPEQKYYTCDEDLDGKTLDELSKLSAASVATDIQEHGWPSEFNGSHNLISFAMIEQCYREHSEAHLWQVNPYNEQPIHFTWEPDQTMYCFGGSILTGRYDEELAHLIQERLDTEYTGTTQDMILVTKIFAQVEKIGGHGLAWS